MAEEGIQESLRDEVDDLQVHIETLAIPDQQLEVEQSAPEDYAAPHMGLSIQGNESTSETTEYVNDTRSELDTVEESISGEQVEDIPGHHVEVTLQCSDTVQATDCEDTLSLSHGQNETEGEDSMVGTDQSISSDGRISLDSEQREHWTLLSLPRELLLNIFDFLDARLVIREVGLVCKMLHEIVSDNLEWKVRFKKRWRGIYPVVPVEDDDFNWKLACIDREETHHRWAKQETNMEHFSLNMAHIAAIDCVHLMNNGELCATGSRDRTFQMWDLRKLDSNDPEKSVKDARTKDVKAHKGWVWDITSLDNLLCTASWDCWLKLWDMNDDMKCVHKLKGKSAFLSVVYEHDMIIAGAYDRSIYLFDPRVNENSLVDQLIHHKRPVLTVQADDHYIISGSEDKSIAIFDRRAHCVYKKLNLESFCMCMSYQHGQLWTGHRDGNVRVIDPTHGSFDIIQTYDVGHKGKITDIMYTMGALYTCSTDSTIRISDPSHNPETMCKLTTHTRDLTAIDLQCGVLASAGSDLTTGIWRPKQDSVVEEFESY
ncbi:F-box/WD repeat-containing protein 9-like [Lytechinus pictus]|uniref:F-box/WD repeat-containing protein 9-like n=1 Tax=Lytechinus pictus TaxID=7653 RepID=UPI0030BA2AC2